MLHARKGPYQSTMNRDDILIKRVPTALAWELCEELNKRIVLNNVYFARKQDIHKRWEVDDIKDELSKIRQSHYELRTFLADCMGKRT